MERTVTTMPVAGPRTSSEPSEQPAARADQPSAAGLRAQEAPSEQVVVGAVPRQPPGFQPRPHLMGQLNRPGSRVSVLTGAPGVGKTQLAAAYARARLTAGWRLVAWVNAGDTGRLLAGLAAVADAAGLSDGSDRDSADAGVVVRRWLEADGDRRLLVFDDAEDPDALRPFIPDSGAARVLITSSQQSAADLGTSIPVDTFSAEEASAVLVGRTGLADDAGAAAVATELGYLPLALAQAATVITRQHLGYAAYLKWLQGLSIDERLTREEGQPYPPGVAEAVLLSLDEIRASDQTGICARMMDFVAVLSAAGVRRELLHAAGQAGVLADSGQRVGADLVDRAVEWLSDQSLMTESMDDRIIMHRLVSQVVREELARRERLTAQCRAAALVLDASVHAVDASQDRPAVRDITEQVTALLDNAAGRPAEADKDLGTVLRRLRFMVLYHLIELGNSAGQAIMVGESLTAEFEQVLGPNHPDTLNSRNSLAAAYQAAGRAADAVPLFEQTLVGRERLLGPDHPDTLNSQNNLAAAYQDAGRTPEAVLLFELTLAARERVLGANHRSTVNSRGNLAAAYRDAGRVDEAIPLFEQTLAIREQVLGHDHPDTLRSRINLANAYRQVGRVVEAIPLTEQLLAIRERLLGADHPKTLSSRNNLAVAYRDAGRPADAVPLFEQNLAACERLLGADHPKTVSTRAHLAAVHQEASQAEEAGHRQDEKPDGHVSESGQ